MCKDTIAFLVSSSLKPFLFEENTVIGDSLLFFLSDAPEVSVTGYDGNWFIGRENVQLRCNADANPLPMEFTWTR